MGHVTSDDDVETLTDEEYKHRERIDTLEGCLREVINACYATELLTSQGDADEFAEAVDRLGDDDRIHCWTLANTLAELASRLEQVL